MVWFGKKQEIQQLNLGVPKLPAGAASATAVNQSTRTPHLVAARLAAVDERVQQILKSGCMPEWVFLCATSHGLLMFRPASDQKPIMLLFTTPFGVRDYLRATTTEGVVKQLRLESLPEMAQSWISAGLEAATLDRCPRCAHLVTLSLTQMAQWTKQDLAKVWAVRFATRSVLGETRIRSAMNHMSAGSHAEARADLEYVRDHFECSVPYLHQWIGVLASMQGDQAAKAAVMEQLKEFGAGFDGPLDLTPELVSKAMVGTMLSFGMQLRSPGSQ